MRVLAPFVLVALVAGCVPRRADGPRAVGGPPQRVELLVIDSLVGTGPLAGTAVSIGERRGVTGADGRTTLDSVLPGDTHLVVRHGIFDGVGLDSLRYAVRVVPGAPAIVVVLRPDESLVAARCPRERRPVGDQGMVVGVVRDADSDRPLAGIEVRGAWREGDSSYAGSGLQVRARTRSGEHGEYVLCRLPRFTHVELAAGTSDERTIARVRFQLGASAVAQHDLSVEPAAQRPRGAAAPPRPIAPAGDAAPAVAPAFGTLAGRVVTTAGIGLPGVQLRLDRPALTLLTDREGRFRIERVPPGVRSVELRALGFRPSRIGLNVRPGERIERDITLDRNVATLGTVAVTARATAAWDSIGFEERRKKGGGYFLTREDLANVVDLSTALRLVPGIRGRSNDKSQQLVAGRGAGCFPAFVVNGTRFSAGQNIGPEALIRAEDIQAMEVYTSRLSTPPEHQRFGDCAVIVIWLRNPQLEREAAARRVREARATPPAPRP
ncbi:MAG: carboxypeptidase-like regulatory domain-containing protein [Gemmatimonadaceae bacterium]|jgi:hypothetical protein|nr:carboxypeptidase-like regulatory domain-containing protein [Gemmatimonadaceae bacterium]